MLNGPFPPWPDFSEEEVAAVSRVLRSNRVNYWTGEEARAFEEEFASFAETRHAVAVSNGTTALDLALHGLGVGEGDEVIVTPRTFLASVSSIVNAGAVPVFADVDPDSQNITADTVAPRITPRTRAILAVHLAGWPCDLAPLTALARQHGLAIIEDCAQAHGARYRGRSVGGLGDVAAWSFCQDKIMSTGGEGGMVTTNDRDLWQRMWAYKDHGKSWEAVYEREHPPGFRWLHESFGTNWRLTEMQAAIGRIQLERMPDWSRRRRHNAETLWQAARGMPGLRVPSLPDDIQHAAYKAYVFVDPAGLAEGWDRDRIQQAVVQGGVPCFSGSCSEVYRERAFDGTGWRPAEPLPVARELGATSLMFLVHPTLGEAEMALTVAVLGDVMARATHRP
ncbi:DegT/DnrJ/EryC1/StrS family aminotransferase [Halomonas nitroreducens]|uniref:DegT/DnrJ/EryC1/StrS aminotransferase family protein n=1 Tax=Halomonas nitroreducens TaxID=447425 RepID=A0A431V6D4_9GAMM|nr:DegT/DnrJ/EryC1/StrS aminotransferase family protein [Halomonas nitroreducens]RTR05041.1 DegT/DnrJ/EryC1/StrS aminotransferase family protein [Halomonas nitroreducens]